ncbi:MAG: hypothetical protein ACR2JS_07460 [Candidatus Nanopelagicales bacterium]
MFGLRRTRRLPSGIRERLEIPKGERVIAWGCDPVNDRYTLATDKALYPEQIRERLRWDSISKATWEEPILNVTVHDTSGATKGTLKLRVEESGDLPAAVFALVTESVVVSEHVDLGNGAGARMVARRDGDEGTIWWSVVFDSGLDSADPALRARADEELASLRDSLGI